MSPQKNALAAPAQHPERTTPQTTRPGAGGQNSNLQVQWERLWLPAHCTLGDHASHHRELGTISFKTVHTVILSHAVHHKSNVCAPIPVFPERPSEGDFAAALSHLPAEKQRGSRGGRGSVSAAWPPAPAWHSGLQQPLLTDTGSERERVGSPPPQPSEGREEPPVPGLGTGCLETPPIGGTRRSPRVTWPGGNALLGTVVGVSVGRGGVGPSGSWSAVQGDLDLGVRGQPGPQQETEPPGSPS